MTLQDCLVRCEKEGEKKQCVVVRACTRVVQPGFLMENNQEIFHFGTPFFLLLYSFQGLRLRLLEALLTSPSKDLQ